MSFADECSSDEDCEVPTTSNIYLGFVDTDFESAGDDPSIEDSFIGGQPVWLHKDSRPSEDLIKCKNCQGKLKLILQAFSPLVKTYYDRVIYVFGCSNVACNRKQGAIRAIRGVRKDPVKIADLVRNEQEDIKNELDEKLKIDSSKDFLFGDKKDHTNPFDNGTNSFGSGSTGNPFNSNPFDKVKEEKPKVELSFAAAVAKNIPPKKASQKSISSKEKLPEYPGYFIYVEQEKFQKKLANQKLPDNIQIDESALDTEIEALTSITGLGSEAQGIASTLQDKAFQQFSEIVNHNPLQILRYDLGGKPLLFSSSDDTSTKIIKQLIPKPGYNPSSRRQYELQVMPKIIMDFEKNEEDIVNGIEWATIIVYTDVEDFIPELDTNHVGYVEEWVGVQWEELNTKKQ